MFSVLTSESKSTLKNTYNVRHGGPTMWEKHFKTHSHEKRLIQCLQFADIDCTHYMHPSFHTFCWSKKVSQIDIMHKLLSIRKSSVVNLTYFTCTCLYNYSILLWWTIKAGWWDCSKWGSCGDLLQWNMGNHLWWWMGYSGCYSGLLKPWLLQI